MPAARRRTAKRCSGSSVSWGWSTSSLQRVVTRARHPRIPSAQPERAGADAAGWRPLGLGVAHDLPLSRSDVRARAVSGQRSRPSAVGWNVGWTGLRITSTRRSWRSSGVTGARQKLTATSTWFGSSLVAAAAVCLYSTRRSQRTRLSAGDELSLADIPVGALMYRYANLDVTDDLLPNVARWYDALTQREVFRKHVMLPFDDLKGRLAN